LVPRDRREEDSGMWRWVLGGAAIAVVLITITHHQPVEIQHVQVASKQVDPALQTELQQLRQLLVQQQQASARQTELLRQLKGELTSGDKIEATDTSTPPRSAGASKGFSVGAPTPNALVAAEDDRQSAALIAEAESKALSMCSEADVPILRLLRSPCPDGMHGYACDERWGLDDKFLPSPAKWRAEWNASARAVTNCQRGFFDAVADHMTRVHWEVEWDAQPFRISAVRTWHVPAHSSRPPCLALFGLLSPCYKRALTAFTALPLLLHVAARCCTLPTAFANRCHRARLGR
jgi:hypothetical protein